MVMVDSSGAPVAALLAPPAAVPEADPELHALTPSASAATASTSGLLKRRGTFIVLLLSVIVNNFFNKGDTRGPARALQAPA
jgi:hypothetical protein